MDVRYRRMYRALVCHGRECNDDFDVGAMNEQERRGVHALVFMFSVIIVLLMLAVALLLFASKARAHDAAHPEHEQWYSELKRPNMEEYSCCGIADAYWADVAHVRNGKLYATITDDREDAPLRGRHHVPVGTEIEVPNETLTWKGGNPTGHVVIFLTGNNEVLCYVQGSGI